MKKILFVLAVVLMAACTPCKVEENTEVLDSVSTEDTVILDTLSVDTL